MQKNTLVADLILPWPPSVNTIWRRVHKPGEKPKTILSKKASTFYLAVKSICSAERKKGNLSVMAEEKPLAVDICLFPPSGQRRDLDNFTKAIFDGLTKAGVWADDSLVQDMHHSFGEIRKDGAVRIIIRKMEEKRAGAAGEGA